MKKLTILIIGLIMIGIVTAGLNTITNSSFKITSTGETIRYKGNITFTVDGKIQGSCYLNEPNMDIDDDFEECIKRYYPNKIISNIKDWTNRDYKEIEINNIIYRSFDEDKLNDLLTLKGEI